MKATCRSLIIPVLAAVVLLLATSCRSDSERARTLLNQAHTLMRNEQPAEAKKVLAAIAEKYGHTQEASEANKLLMGFKVAEDVGTARLNETQKSALLTALATFRLDCDRYPSQEEGLKALTTNPGIKGWDGPYLPPESNLIAKFTYKYRGAQEPELLMPGSRH